MKKKKKSKWIAIIIIISVIILSAGTTAALYLTHTVDIPAIDKILNRTRPQEQAAGSVPAAYVVYTDTYIVIDRGMNVISTTMEQPADIPRISGFDFTSFTIGQPLVSDNEVHFDYAMFIVGEMSKRKLGNVSEIFISSEGEATIYVKKIKILLGMDKDTGKKVEDLSGFYDEVTGKAGTLYMTELSADNIGYTFKVDGMN